MLIELKQMKALDSEGKNSSSNILIFLVMWGESLTFLEPQFLFNEMGRVGLIREDKYKVILQQGGWKREGGQWWAQSTAPERNSQAVKVEER